MARVKAKALTINNLLAKKFKRIEFSENFRAAFGEPETTGVWFIYGGTTNGKTAFVMQLIKELSVLGKVLINSLEEGNRASLQDVVKRSDMTTYNSKVLIQRLQMPDLIVWLKKTRNVKVVIIDSFQYTYMSLRDVIDFEEMFPDKLIIFTSQVDGKQPKGRTADRVRFHASLKIWVEGFKAFSQGRTVGETGEYVIWADGAAKYWGEK